MVILTIRTQALGRLLCLVIAILMMAAPAVAQPPSPDNDREQAVAQSPAETMDVFDLVRKHEVAQARPNRVADQPLSWRARSNSTAKRRHHQSRGGPAAGRMRCSSNDSGCLESRELTRTVRRTFVKIARRALEVRAHTNGRSRRDLSPELRTERVFHPRLDRGRVHSVREVGSSA